MSSSTAPGTRICRRTRRGAPLFACLLALAGCPAETPGDTTDATSTGPGATEPGSTGPGASTPTDPGATEPATTGPGPTDPGATEPGTSAGTTDPASTDPDTTAGESTDTGPVDCAPGWEVPRVDAGELAKHDLRWVGCEFTACGPDDAPAPGEPSLLCAPFAVADAPLTYLGHMHPNESGAFTTGDVISPNNIAWLDGPRHIYRYDENVYILVEGDGAVDQLEVFYTVRALELLRVDHPTVYQQLLVDPGELPDGPPLDGFGWKNRLRSFVISFDASPLAVVAGIAVLDAAPVADMQAGVDVYSNVAAVSVDRETILGASEDVGSRPIYGKPGDDENFLRYMREGLVEALVHELVRQRIDRLNSTDADMNELWNRRVAVNACAQLELEEALVGATSLLAVRAGLGDAYLDYYEVVLDANLAAVAACPEYAAWSGQFSFPSGVDERYDLRLFDLQ